MVPAGNPCAELESWSGLIAGRTIPHPDTVWRWVPGDCMHTHIHACSLAHTTCLSSLLALSPLFPCPAASFAPLLPFLSPNPVIDGYDSTFFLLTHVSIVDLPFPHVKSHYFSTKKKNKTVFSYIIYGLCYLMFILSMQAFPLSCHLKVVRMQHLTGVCYSDQLI